MEDVQGTTLGRYWLDTLIGQGNRASVYQATPLEGGEPVAIRVFDRTLNTELGFAAHFRQLAATLSTVRHPHLLPITEFGEQDGRAFLVRPYIAGSSLRRLLGTPLPLPEVLRLLGPIAAVLDFAHAQGLLHGDVKPGNILLPWSGEVALADLGIAQLLPRGNSLLMAATGRYYGTPEYLSPEQVHALALTGQTDEYALGIILYEALVGRPPFRAESPADTPRTVAARHITAPPPGPRTLNPALSQAVERVLLRALDKDPDRRFPSCIALMDALADADGLTSALFAVLPLPAEEPSADLLDDTEPYTPETALLATDDTPPESPESTTLERLAAQHVAELWALSADYETQLAAHARQLRDREDTITTLTQQLLSAREEQAQLAARILELERDRDALATRAKEVAATPLPPPRPESPPLPAPALGQLAILDPQRYGLPRGASFALLPSATIGRHPNSTIPLDDSYVSAHHAQLTQEADGWWVTDLGTKNGTFVNDVRVKSPTRLTPGDTLRFGRVRANFA